MRENHEGNVFSPMGCRSFLTAWKDPATGEYKYEGRFNQGVVLHQPAPDRPDRQRRRPQGAESDRRLLEAAG